MYTSNRQSMFLTRNRMNHTHESRLSFPNHTTLGASHTISDTNDSHLYRMNTTQNHEQHSKSRDMYSNIHSTNSLQASRARLSSQQLFLSVIQEWHNDANQTISYDSPSSPRDYVSPLPQNTQSSYSSRRKYSISSEESYTSDIDRKYNTIKKRQEISPTSVHKVSGGTSPLVLDYAITSADTSLQINKKIGIYSPRSRQVLLQKYMRKRTKRLSQNKVRYRVRKTLANARPRVKGRFVKTEMPVTAALVEAHANAQQMESKMNLQHRPTEE